MFDLTAKLIDKFTIKKLDNMVGVDKNNLNTIK